MAGQTIHRIKFPDGIDREISAPAAATPEQIVEYAQQIYPDILKQENEEQRLKSLYSGISGPDAALQAAVRNIPFGTDIQAGGAALLTGTPFSEAKKLMMEYTEQAQERKPKSSVAGAIGGGTASALALLPAKLAQGATVTTRALGQALGAAGLGFGYGVQEGESVGQRIGGGLVQAGTEAPFGALGSVGVDAIIGGGQAVIREAGKGINRFTQPSRASADSVAKSGRGLRNPNVDPAQQISMQQGNTIPLTQGQMTQNAKQQALEAGALRSPAAYGEEANQLALKARELQSDAGIDQLSRIAGTRITDQGELSASENILKGLKNSYKQAKLKTRNAYQNLAPERVAGFYVRDSVLPAIKDFKVNGTGGLGGFDLNAPGMDQANYFYKELQKFGNKNIKDINLNSLETWRGGVKAATRKTQILPKEKMFLENMVGIFDDAMNQLPREALKSGDDEIFNKLLKARSLRAEQGIKFERNKFIKDILDKDDITPEQFRTMVFGKGKTFKDDAALRLRSILKATPEKADEIRQVTKSGTYSNIFRNSLLDEVKEGGTQKMLSFDKLETNLEELINNQSFFKELHPDKAERQAIKAFYDDVLKIKSQKPGTVNYSNTAYKIMDWMDNLSPTAMRAGLPFVPSPKEVLTGLAQTGATVDLKKQLGAVLQENLNEMDSKTFNFLNTYGREAVTGAIPSYIRQEQE
jgi:hypothetical protein